MKVSNYRGELAGSVHALTHSPQLVQVLVALLSQLPSLPLPTCTNDVKLFIQVYTIPLNLYYTLYMEQSMEKVPLNMCCLLYKE